jgi:hypoxanthine-DNA glycosylase
VSGPRPGRELPEGEAGRWHGLAPIEGQRALVLVLGSLPGRISIDAAQYYAHPRNAFWDVLERLGVVERSRAYPERCATLIARGIALWDVARSGVRRGSLDADLHAIVANDLAGFHARHPELERVLFNGRKARALFDRSGLALSGVELVDLPSTSPANTRRDKLDAWLDALGARSG